MTVWDQSYGDGYSEQTASTVFESPSYTEDVDLGPAMPQSSTGNGFKPAHGVLAIFLFAVFALFVLSRVFHTHNLG